MTKMENKKWYQVQAFYADGSTYTDESDNGSYEFDKAVKMAHEQAAEAIEDGETGIDWQIAEWTVTEDEIIDYCIGEYDINGNVVRK